MTIEDIQKLFQTSAALRHCPFVDPRRPMLEETVDKMTAQYVSEYLDGKDVGSSQPPKMGIQEAFNILASTCESAMALELEHHPNGITNEQIESIAYARKIALETVVDELAKKVQS